MQVKVIIKQRKGSKPLGKRTVNNIIRETVLVLARVLSAFGTLWLKRRQKEVLVGNH